MSERILRALMQLFAIVAKVDEVSFDSDNPDDTASIQSTKGKQIIESFLKSELSSSDVNKYLSIFENFLNATRAKLYAKSGGQKRTSLQSVKVLRICEQINKELTQRQKFIVLIRIFEFVNADNAKSETEIEFVKTVADSFHINDAEFQHIHRFIDSTKNDIVDEKNHVYYCSENKFDLKIAKSAILDGLDEPIHAILIPSVKTVFFKYYGNEEFYVNGQIVANDKTHVFNIGSTIRTAKTGQVFYSDIISQLTEREDHQKLTFEMTNIMHSFKTGGNALRKISIATNEGQLIGIMGGSGTGKTTILNIMNGKMKPSYGKLTINGIDLHEHPAQLQGVIGNISQDDILIEELSVFDNLFYSAKLCLGGLTDAQLTKKVVDVLKSLGLYEIRKLKVGSVLEKVISGGQRKRLNIALELIREPSILFVDEPTSGLSSRDSENIIDLLKELSINGKLVFVVIHQPSSNIFKLFDRLLIMDTGGYPIYDGIPLNAIAHFKTFSFRGNAHERECSLCGNVNPEQIFNIIDAKIVDEYGNETPSRRKDPKDWNDLYERHKPKYQIAEIKTPPSTGSKLPSRFSQFISYFKRDLLSKVSNVQYIIVNTLVPPILALVLSFFIKYFGWTDGIQQYTFLKNQNIPQYIFIAVIVSIFLGLTIAAEEINKDKKILDREKFLHLSRQSYLLSKVGILVGISAIQALTFVLIGNTILEIKGMWFEYWVILFSTSVVSNLMGLNISSAFNSAKVIYIIVPLLIIPQLLFSGVIVKFDKLHPSLSDATKVPWIGKMMVSRWAYEAITVEQVTGNELEKYYFVKKCDISNAQWKKDYWLPEMQSQMSKLVAEKDQTSPKALAAIEIISNEIQREEEYWDNLKCDGCLTELKSKNFKSEADFVKINQFLDVIKLQSINTINSKNDEIQGIIDSIGLNEYRKLREQYANESLEDLTTNRIEENKFLISDGRIYQNDDPIYNDPKGTSFFNTHFYSPYKYAFGKKISSFNANLIVIWFFAIISYIVLYFDLLKKFIDGSVNLFGRLRTKKAAKN